MGVYILKRILLMIPTLFGVMLITFVVTQFVPGGPVEKLIAEMEGHGARGEAAAGGDRFPVSRRLRSRSGEDGTAEEDVRF